MPGTLARFGFLYRGYTILYFEVWDMLRKLMISGIPSIVATQPVGSTQVDALQHMKPLSPYFFVLQCCIHTLLPLHIDIDSTAWSQTHMYYACACHQPRCRHASANESICARAGPMLLMHLVMFHSAVSKHPSCRTIFTFNKVTIRVAGNSVNGAVLQTNSCTSA